jgi:TonB family protein
LPQQAAVKPASPSPTPQSAPHAAPGRPIEQADRDSDLFAQRTAVDAKAGRMIARNGRGFKFTRPKVNLATYVDSAMISFPVIIDMLVRVDPAGRVQDVTVLRSTGAAGIDRAIVLAMYESSFDVIHDAAGRPVAETQRLPMRFH